MGRAKELAIAYHELAIMLDAGMPMLKSLATVAGSFEGRTGRGFAALEEGVGRGSSVSETMKKHANLFASLDVMLVDAADTSGSLPLAFKMLSEWYDFCGRLKGVIISGLALPFMILHVAAFVGPLPFLLMGRMGIGGYIYQVLTTLAVFYVPAGVIFYIWRVMPSRGAVRRAFDFMVLKIFGAAVRRLALSRYCRAFYMLYKAGVPITQCAQKASGVTGNLVVAELLKGGARSAEAGNLVCEGFSARLPADFLNLWRIGEESGELDKCLKKLADNTSDTAEHLLVEYARWLPRLIYFLVMVLLVMMILRGAAAIGML